MYHVELDFSFDCALLLHDFVVSDKVQMPDHLGQAVGEERWELLARLAGNEVRICAVHSQP